MIRNAVGADLDTILALNLADEHHLSPLDSMRLARLHEQATSHRVVTTGEDAVVGFLLAFDDASGYTGLNFRWFAHRFRKFIYIDRVVVVDSLRGRGLGRALYEDLFAIAGQLGIRDVVCEYDIDPPNPGSAAFHAAMGFHEIGRFTAAPRTKVCSMQHLNLTDLA